MRQKIVSFEVAKTIKEAGYPQLKADWSYSAYNGELYNLVDTEDYFISAPTYLDVWLWLWKVKDIKLSVAEIDDVVKAYIRGSKPLISQFSADPEGAIINIIEFLVDNDLIK